MNRSGILGVLRDGIRFDVINCHMAAHGAKTVLVFSISMRHQPLSSIVHQLFIHHTMSKAIISTTQAPAAVGPYSQAAHAVGKLTFLSGQLGLHPATGELVQPFEEQVKQAFANMSAVVAACGGQLSDVVKVTLFVTDMAKFPVVNNIMAQVMPQPYCARSTVGVASLPKGGEFEVEAILAIE